MAAPIEHQMAVAMLTLTGMLEPVAEAVDGYRADCERRGYSPTAAETMTLQFHSVVIAQIIASSAGGTNDDQETR